MEPRPSLGRALFEIGEVVFKRFAPLPRVWAVWLVGVNAAAVAFVGHLEAQVALAAVGLALLAMALIYQRLGFVRLLGIGHTLWIPMLPWLVTRLGDVSAGDGAFRAWLLALLVTNGISLVIDAVDVTRFVRGERAPYYTL